MLGDQPTVPVVVTVLEVRRTPRSGRLLALATVTIDLGVFEITLHGVQVVRQPSGRIRCRAPRCRGHTGAWEPAVTLPEELEAAIGREVMVAGRFMAEESP